MTARRNIHHHEAQINRLMIRQKIMGASDYITLHNLMDILKQHADGVDVAFNQYYRPGVRAFLHVMSLEIADLANWKRWNAHWGGIYWFAECYNADEHFPYWDLVRRQALFLPNRSMGYKYFSRCVRSRADIYCLKLVTRLLYAKRIGVWGGPACVGM